MSLESFRRALGVRHAEWTACARARLMGERCDEARLDELDADLFSRDATGEAVSLWRTARAGGTGGAASLASARSRLAIVLEEGMLARLRFLDRALESAYARGRDEEAAELSDERRRVIAEEGARPLLGAPRESSSAASAPATAPRTESPSFVRALAAEVRGGSEATLPASARRLLDESASVAELSAGLAGTLGGGRTELGPGGGGGKRESGAPIADVDPLAGVLESWCGPSPSFPGSLVVPALRELGTDLDLDPGAEMRIAQRTHAVDPAVLEIDPPDDVLLVLPAGEGLDGFGASLMAWGASLSARLRSRSLPEEHRLRADGAIAAAVGELAAALAPEHAQLRRELVPARRRSLAREIASARLSAALFLDRDRLLSEAGSGRRDAGAALEEASLGRLRRGALERPRRPVFEALDRFRGHLLAPYLRERLRTRFGNLWYRERGAGRFLREICEPGGSVPVAEILTGLSLPLPSAESLVDSWRDEIKRLR